MEALRGRRLPTIAVVVTEEHLQTRPVATVPDPAAETEIKRLLTQAGVTVKDLPSNELAPWARRLREDQRAPWPQGLDGVDVVITGEAFSEFGARIGNLFSCVGRAGINVIRRGDGRIELAERTTTRGIDLAENIAGKNSARKGRPQNRPAHPGALGEDPAGGGMREDRSMMNSRDTKQKEFRQFCCTLSVLSLTMMMLAGRAAHGQSLHEAAAKGDLAALQRQVEGGADLDAWDEQKKWTPLIWAIDAGQTAAAEWLIARGADVHKLTEGNSSPVGVAAHMGNLAIIRLLVERGADVNASVPPRVTPLALAAANGHIDAMALLVQLGADVKGANQVGLTALHVAAFQGQIEALTWLLGKGADVHQRNQFGFTALAAAAEQGHPAAVDLLLERGARADESNGDVSVVHLAADHGHSDVVRQLLDGGAPVAPDLRYDSPLTRSAATHGDLELLHELLHRGAPLEMWNSGVAEAAEAGHLDVVRFLLQRGVRMSEEKDKNPFQKAMDNGHGEIVGLLMQARRKWRGLEPKPQHEREDEIVLAAYRGETARLKALLQETSDADAYALEAAKRLAQVEGHIEASLLIDPALASAREDAKKRIKLQEHLMKMAERGDLREVRLALEAGADAAWWDPSSGMTALYQAAGKGHLEIVKLLLENGAQVNSRRGYLNRTAVGTAAHSGHVEVVRLLIERGAYLDARAGWLQPLALAASAGHAEVVRLLLDAGAEINAQSEGAYERKLPGATALMKAAENGHTAVVDLLLARGADARLHDDRGMTAQELALSQGHRELAAKLQAVTGQRAQHVRIPLDDAIRRSAPLEEIRQLLQRGADANQVDSLYHKPVLNEAVQLQGSADYRLRMVKLLIDEGADVQAVDGLLISALLYGADEALLKLLIEQGADVNDRRGWQGGLSPLLVAVEKDNMPAVRLLIAQGADATVRRDDGRSVMQLAAEGSHKEIARLLEERARRKRAE
jgi:ankyrin repeat protein